jgi:hypothetical protein
MLFISKKLDKFVLVGGYRFCQNMFYVSELIRNMPHWEFGGLPELLHNETSRTAKAWYPACNHFQLANIFLIYV